MPEPMPEMEWLRMHGQEYSGQRVALNRAGLLSHGPDVRGVRDAARAKGVQTSLMVHIPGVPSLPYPSEAVWEAIWQ